MIVTAFGEQQMKIVYKKNSSDNQSLYRMNALSFRKIER